MTGKTLTKLNSDEVCTKALADFWRCSPIDASLRIKDTNGDVHLTAKEAMAIAAIIEEIVGSELFTPNDFATIATKIKSTDDRKSISPNGCMDPAEESSFCKLKGMLDKKLALAA